MNTREQFGKYLLLKKLTEDPLGETFRAGMLGASGMERVALLRVMNGQGINGQRLWQATQGRSGVQQLLRSPNLGEGIEMGEVQGIPYVAYDYISGKNLATLLEQAAVKRNFIPAEHALLITERIALGLASASEQRLGAERILHGFLVPHLVMISNEGETRLLGFEVAPALRSFAANPVTRQHFGRYLAPEALAGQPPHRADDIYSLGVLLLELLTGKPLPPPAPDGFATIIDQSVIATEGTPIPPDLANLLKHSLVARDHRMADVVTWHKTLNKWMFDGQYNPTTFNLAFFMHNLFRQDIERESQEIEVEKTLPLPVVQTGAAATGAAATAAAAAAAAATAAAASAAVPVPATAEVPVPATAEVPVAAPAPSLDGSGVREATDVREVTAAVPVQKKSKAGLIGALAVAALLLLLGGGYFWWQGRQAASSPESQAAVQPAPVAAAPVEPEPEVPAGPTPEEISEQIRSLVGERATEMEEALRSQYNKQLNDLQRQLETAKKDAESRRQREAEALAEQQAKEEEAEKEAEAARIAEEEAAVAAAEEKKEAEAEEATEVAAAAPPPEPTPPPPPAAPAPQTQVRRGDLVSMGRGVVAPKLVRRPTPRFPIMAKRLNKKEAKVLLRVLIDENGKVIKAELAGKQAGFGFDDEAMSAARKSTYQPATKDGVPVKFWHHLAVEFRDK